VLLRTFPQNATEPRPVATIATIRARGHAWSSPARGQLWQSCGRAGLCIPGRRRQGASWGKFVAAGAGSPKL